MNILRRPASYLLAIAVAVACAMSLLTPPAEAVTFATVDRVAGSDRIEAAIGVAETAFPGGSATVVIARVDAFPDALSGAPLAALEQAPILFTGSTHLDVGVARAIGALGAQRAVLLGGHAALSPQVEADLAAAGVQTVERIAGPDRFTTSKAIAERVLAGTGVRHAYLALGSHGDPNRAWADAVAVSGLAAWQGNPVLLTTPEGLSDATAEVLAGLDSATLVGGTAALPEAIEQQVAALGIAVDRIAGPSRFHTSLAIANRAQSLGASPEHIWLATGSNFSDALAAVPAVAVHGDVMMLADGHSWQSQPARDYLGRNKGSVRKVHLVGEEALFPSLVGEDIEQLLAGPLAELVAPTTPAAPVAGPVTFSEGELEVWRTRAAQGPYKATGDAGPNSPGDWDRITANARAFMPAPSTGRWAGPAGTGCVQPGTPGPPPAGMDLLRDAAFTALVTDDDRMRQAVATELLAQAQTPGVNFADTDRWCTGLVHDLNPGFEIAYWMTRLALAYDYIGADTLTAAENEVLRSWFWHAARWLQRDTDRKLDENFINRTAGDYRLSPMRQSDPGWGKVGFLGSQQTGAIARYYNNRRATSMFYVALIGVQQDDSDMRASATRFTKEWLMFSVYPDGWTGEFERWRSDLPDLGWAYSTYNVALAAMTADLFARQGNTELYTFTTSNGVHGTEGGPKNLHTVLRDHAGYLDGTHTRYGTDNPANAGPSHLINGSVDSANWHSVHDVAATIGNLYYDDPYLADTYTRTATGYPTRVASQGPFNAWQGVWGIYPGVLFMHGQMETTSPY